MEETYTCVCRWVESPTTWLRLCLIIVFKYYGVSLPQDEFIEIVEQNVEDAVWPEGREYSRRLSVSVSAHGLLTLVDLEYGGANVIMGERGRYQRITHQ